jgi:Fe-S cluster assembly ATP-binding protein
MIYQDSKPILEVSGLCATVNGIEILKDLDFTVKSGEVHAIMGPNGSGKSTFAKVLAGHTAYEVTAGSVLFEGNNLFELEPDERARAGVFLAFQYPIEIPGVANSQFLRLSYNTVQAQRGHEELDPLEFDDFVREKMKLLEMSPNFLDRSVNEGFSGGEKKRNEILQMALLDPRLAILDETDSGLACLTTACPTLYTLWMRVASSRPVARSWRSNSNLVATIGLVSKTTRRWHYHEHLSFYS